MLPIFHAIFRWSPQKYKTRVLLHCDASKASWMGGACGTPRREEKYRVLSGKPEGERLCEGCRHRWEGNIKMCIKEIGGVHGLD
jgi:hypothetical protein